MITYRQATRDEFNLVIRWASEEGWNPGLHDADLFWGTDSSGFVCAERDGEVIATGSIVSYGKDFGFMGFFIVRPDLRNLGIGRDFWYWRRDALRARLQPNAPIGMDGVFNMQPFYAKSGFKFTHRNLRMEGIGKAQDVDARLTELSDIPFDLIKDYDQRHFGFKRASFLKSWIQPNDGLALGAQQNGTLKGMGVIRACLNGFKVGPLFANDANTANRIFAALSNHAADKAIYLDIPENNPAAVALAKQHQLEEVFGCARMYHGSAPELPWQHIYGITTFELG